MTAKHPAPPTERDFGHWETLRDLVDQLIDLMLNLRQSGHPGGSRSKAPLFIAALLSGVMRWDVRDPARRFADRFVLGAGHTVPLVYATLALLAECLRLEHERTARSEFEFDPANLVLPDDLLGFRRRGGLPGHAEMSGKTHFLKFNTGPSGHGLPAAAGIALALKRAGAEQVRVFVLEGEAGLTPGGVHEAKNVAWGLGLSNLRLLLDWNDFGIDPHRVSSVVAGGPRDWFEPAGWRVVEATDGDDWAALAAAFASLESDSADARPALLYAPTRKGRGYLKYDYESHGSPHAYNSPIFWETKRPFMEKYGVRFEGFGLPGPTSDAERREQARVNIGRVIDVLREHSDLRATIANRLIELADAINDDPPGLKLRPTPITASPCDDASLFDPHSYPSDLWVAPGTLISNKEALGRWGGWINDTCAQRYGRPLFLACSADLAHSTSIAGFAGRWGWYDRSANPDGALLPQEITEFVNSALMAGVAATNLAADPWTRFDGFYGACSTYGAFVYLKYGLMRLFSQLAQDSRIKVGKILWVAGHSGPETADDSRTHFGIFAPGVTQLFPDGAIVEIHPWEYNEVVVALAAALRHPAPLVALHLARPPVRTPDRAALGLPSHFAAERGAYVIRPYRSGLPRQGTVIVQGSATTAGVIELLPEFDRRGLNVKIVAAISPQLFACQEPAYRDAVLSEEDRYDAMCVTNRALRLMTDWIACDSVRSYSVSSDWDSRWRTGGTVAEVLDEAHLSPEWILRSIERFALERDERLRRMRAVLSRIETAE